MQLFFVITLLVAVVHAESAAVPEEYHTEKVDLDMILKNERLLKNYVDCILDRGSCTSAGTDLKRIIPEALQNECAKCKEQHKEGVKKVVKYLIKNKPEIWKELLEKFDPKGEYKVKYAKYLEDESLAA